MPRIFYTLLVVAITRSLSYGQGYDQQIRLEVLRHNDVNKEYKYTNKKDQTTTLLKYLGQVKTTSGASYKILTSVWLWGQSHRATSRILIYDSFNRYIGQYHVDMIYDLSNAVKGTQLVFLNSDNLGSGCDLHAVTYIDLSNGLPKQIFIKCKGDAGDVYSFERD
jgi:hypothetical protein